MNDKKLVRCAACDWCCLLWKKEPGKSQLLSGWDRMRGHLQDAHPALYRRVYAYAMTDGQGGHCDTHSDALTDERVYSKMERLSRRRNRSRAITWL